VHGARGALIVARIRAPIEHHVEGSSRVEVYRSEHRRRSMGDGDGAEPEQLMRRPEQAAGTEGDDQEVHIGE